MTFNPILIDMHIHPDFDTLIAIENKKILESVAVHGLRPLDQIPKSVLVNSTTPLATTAGNICVNYVNLKGSDVDLALKTVIEEEYTGILGIALERQWPYASKKMDKETYERLHANLVFVLAPPQKKPGRYPVQTNTGLSHPLPFAFYETDVDGFSQNRGKSLIEGRQLPHSYAVTEIKTTHAFSNKDILAILAPEAYYEMAAEVFGRDKLYLIPNKPIRLDTFSEYLYITHDESIKAPMTLDAPDYFSALKTCTKDLELQQFSLHCLRLNTNFDFVTRKVCGVSGLEKLFAESKASVLARNDQDEAWVFIHKKYAYDREPIYHRLAERRIPPSLIEKLIKSATLEQNIFKAYRDHKGPYRLSLIPEKLAKFKQLELVKLGIDVLDNPHCTMLAFHPSLALKLRAIVEAPIKPLASTKIQACYRGHNTRNLFFKFKEAKHEFEVAKHKMETLGAKLFS